MAATSKLVHVRPNPGLNTVRLFSSSTSSTPSPPPDSADKPPEPDSRSQFSSYFSDVKATLKQTQQMNPSPRPAPSRPFNFPPPNPSTSPPPNPSMPPPPPKLTSLEDIGKMVSGLRYRTVPSTPGSQPPSPASHISFQDILQKNVNSRSQGSSLNDEKPGSNYAFSSIRESLKQLKLPTEKNPNLNKSLSEYQQSFKLRISNDPGGIDSHILTSGTDSLPFPVFAKEMAYAEDNEAKKTELVKYYSVKELGEKLKSLRPEKKGDKKDWFSLDELSERLVKLRQMELEMDKGNESKNTTAHLKNALSKMTQYNHDKTKNLSMQRLKSLDALSHHGRTPSMLRPPKEELVEKYFHPDNMSASEKLKLKLQKVRDEFKMSETDCGSARVQVAQLTTKINHLAGVLHKKDKHSRKGLQGMLQKRKSLLKYLRRTDWESYSFVLSKLGLRDNPEIKG